MSVKRTTPRLSPATLARARQMRREMTPAEGALWNALRGTFPAAHFRHQVPFGAYYADFASHGAKLVIEVDGGQHGEAIDYDAGRTAFLNGEGYKVLRFWNNQVLRELDGVLTAIAAQLPSPLVGEGASKRRMGGARQSRARALRPAPPTLPSPTRGEEKATARRSRAPALRAGTPHPLPSPTRGEGGYDKSVDLESV